MTTSARDTDLAVEFFTDPASFLSAAGPHLAAAPVVTNVVATIASRAARTGPQGAPYEWYATAANGGEVVGVAMRTAPFAPYPLYVSPMPDDAARLLARALHERGEHPGGSNGSLPAARVVAEESVRLWGGRVEVAMHSRLWELGELVVPSGPAGAPRPATYDDAELCRDWYNDFGRAAREQAGNSESAQGSPHESLEDIRRRIDDGRILLWERDGEVVHLTGFNPPAYGVARIGPVYTPDEHRGRGYASAAVAEASRRLLAQGARVCLFTDRGNPVSNHVYAKLGFRPLVDTANHTVVS